MRKPKRTLTVLCLFVLLVSGVVQWGQQTGWAQGEFFTDLIPNADMVRSIGTALLRVFRVYTNEIHDGTVGVTTAAIYEAVQNYETAGGDMLKSTYDTGDDGKIDTAAGGTNQNSSGWTGVPYFSGAGTWANEAQTAPVRGGTGKDFSGSTGVVKYTAGTASADANLNDLADVNAGAPSDNQALVWDSGTSKWIPGVAVGTATPPLGFDMDWLGGDTYFQHYALRVGTGITPTGGSYLIDADSLVSQTNWTYWNGVNVVAVPSTGVSYIYSGLRVEYDPTGTAAVAETIYYVWRRVYNIDDTNWGDWKQIGSFYLD